MNILTLGQNVLREMAEPYKTIDAETARLAVQMLETMHDGHGIGLAGPQIGVAKRIFVVHINDDVPRIFINPEITGTATDLVKYEEGCLSIPGIYADVKRPDSVSVRAYNEKGRAFSLEADGLLARVIQHEFDHLNGVLFIDHLSELKRKRILKIWEEKFRA